MIQVTNLKKSYGDRTVLNGLTFTIGDGGVYGFLGPNGAGKSTAMNIITGCTPAASGSVLINGIDIAKKPSDAKRHIGYLPEIPPLYEDMTPYEYLVFVAEAKNVPYEKLYRQVDEALELTRTDSVRSRLIRNLSKGYRQRIGIAQALLGNPDIIILDEPTSGLDPNELTEIHALVRMLGKMKTVIISSHILTEISEICENIIIISDGKTVAADTVENLKIKFGGACSLRLSIRGNEDEVLPVLKAVDGVTDIALSAKKVDGIIEIIVSYQKGVEIRDPVFALLAATGAPILSMETEESSLEDVFRALTDTDAAPDVPDAPVKKRCLFSKLKKEKGKEENPK